LAVDLHVDRAAEGNSTSNGPDASGKELKMNDRKDASAPQPSRAEVLEPKEVADWLDAEGRKLSSSFDCDVEPLFEAAKTLRMLFVDPETS
jgi:hypothetical protein